MSSSWMEGALTSLVQKMFVRADSKINLARSQIGMVVRAGAAKPDIGSVELLRSPAFPLRVSNPEFTASPKVTEPESRRALVTPIAEPEALEMRPPNRLSVPTPKA